MAGTMRVALSARKGGVGKSALTVLTARELAAQGARVLVLDLDPQRMSSSIRLGADIESPLRYTAVDLVLGAKGRAFAPQAVAPGLDVIAANQRDVAVLEHHLRELYELRRTAQGATARRAILDLRLGAVEAGYDFVVLDTPTYFGEITTNALECAHLVLSPINMKASDDVGSVLDLLEHLGELSHPVPAYFIPNFWDGRLRECKLALARARDLIAPERLLVDATLPACTAVPAAMSAHRAIEATSDAAVVLRERVYKLGQKLLGREPGLGLELSPVGGA